MLGRVWREGTAATKVVTYRLLATGTLEEKVFQRQIQKTELSLGAVDDDAEKAQRAYRFSLRAPQRHLPLRGAQCSPPALHRSSDELAAIFEYEAQTHSSTYELQGHEQNLVTSDEHLLAAVRDGFVSHVHEEGKEEGHLVDDFAATTTSAAQGAHDEAQAGQGASG